MSYYENLYGLVGSSNSQSNNNMEEAKEKLFRMEINKIMEMRNENSAARKNKRIRSAFTTDQVNYLEQEFKKHPYIGPPQRKELSGILKISERAIKIWFQNRRMKEKNTAGYKDLEIDERFGNDFANHFLHTNANSSINDLQRNQLPALTITPVDEIKNNSTSNRSVCDEMAPFNGPSSFSSIAHTSPSLDIGPSNCTPQNDLQGPSGIKYFRPSPNLDQPSTSSGSNNLAQTLLRSLAHIDKTSAEYSIRLFKKYEPVRIYLNDMKNKLILEKSKMILKKEESTVDSQSGPEDLSQKHPKTIVANNLEKNVNLDNTGYQPNYMANYNSFMAAGKMLWKPVNAVPSISPSTSTNNLSSASTSAMASTSAAALQSTLATPIVSSSSGPSVGNQEQKKQCYCDCHKDDSPTSPENNESSQSQSQYILSALPFQNCFDL